MASSSDNLLTQVSSSRRSRSATDVKDPEEMEVADERRESNKGTSKQKANDNSPSRSADSPEPNCAICLGKLENKSFTDSCFHMFCFVCLLEWSKVKAECPLCKQQFKSIIHNVRSYDDYEQYHLERPENQFSWENPGGRRFRYHSTMTGDRFMSFLAPWESYQPSQARQSQSYQFEATLRHQNRVRRREPATSSFRRRVYTNGWKIRKVDETNNRYRNVSPEFFASNPATLHRLVPWLNRELNALIQIDDHVQFILELILGLIKRYSIISEEFHQHISPLLGRYTRQFMQEFYSFARSPFNMVAYDERVVYQPNPEQILDSSSSSNEDDDSDVIILSPESESIPQQTAVHEDHSYNANRWLSSPSNQQSFSPLNLSTSILSQSGWDSPIPGPSWSTADTSEQVPNSGNSCSHSSTTVKHEQTSKKSPSDTDSDSVSNPNSSDDDDNDVEIVAFEKPWQQRSPIVLSSDSEEDIVTATSESVNTKESLKVKIRFRDNKPEIYHSTRHETQHYDNSSNSSFQRRQSRSRSPAWNTSKSRSLIHSKSTESRHHRSHSSAGSRSSHRRSHRRNRRRSRSEHNEQSQRRHRFSSEERYSHKSRSRTSKRKHRHCSSASHSRSRSPHNVHHRSKRKRSRSVSVEIVTYKHRSSHKKHKKHKKQKRHKHDRDDKNVDRERYKRAESGRSQVLALATSSKSLESSEHSEARKHYKKHPSGHKKSRSAVVPANEQTDIGSLASMVNVAAEVEIQTQDGGTSLPPAVASSTNLHLGSSSSSSTDLSSSSHESVSQQSSASCYSSTDSSKTVPIVVIDGSSEDDSDNLDRIAGTVTQQPAPSVSGNSLNQNFSSLPDGVLFDRTFQSLVDNLEATIFGSQGPLWASRNNAACVNSSSSESGMKNKRVNEDRDSNKISKEPLQINTLPSYQPYSENLSRLFTSGQQNAPTTAQKNNKTSTLPKKCLEDSVGHAVPNISTQSASNLADRRGLFESLEAAINWQDSNLVSCQYECAMESDRPQQSTEFGNSRDPFLETSSQSILGNRYNYSCLTRYPSVDSSDNAASVDNQSRRTLSGSLDVTAEATNSLPSRQQLSLTSRALQAQENCGDSSSGSLEVDGKKDTSNSVTNSISEDSESSSGAETLDIPTVNVMELTKYGQFSTTADCTGSLLPTSAHQGNVGHASSSSLLTGSDQDASAVCSLDAGSDQHSQSASVEDSGSGASDSDSSGEENCTAQEDVYAFSSAALDFHKKFPAALPDHYEDSSSDSDEMSSD